MQDWKKLVTNEGVGLSMSQMCWALTRQQVSNITSHLIPLCSVAQVSRIYTCQSTSWPLPHSRWRRSRSGDWHHIQGGENRLSYTSGWSEVQPKPQPQSEGGDVSLDNILKCLLCWRGDHGLEGVWDSYCEPSLTRPPSYQKPTCYGRRQNKIKSFSNTIWTAVLVMARRRKGGDTEHIVQICYAKSYGLI